MAPRKQKTASSPSTGVLPPIVISEKLRASIKTAFTELAAIAGEHEVATAEKRAIYERLSALGLNRDGFKSVLKYMSMNEAQRQNYDATMEVAREVLGEPMQTNLLKPTAGDLQEAVAGFSGEDSAPREARH